MQDAATTGTWANLDAAATVTAAGFGVDADSDDKHITPTNMSARARAQSNLWFMAWSLDALNEAWFGPNTGTAASPTYD